MTTHAPRKPTRPWIGARISPETAAWIAQERDRTGEKLGRLLDRLVSTQAPAKEVSHD